MGQGRAALLSLCLGALLLVARAGHVLPLHHRHTDPARGRRLLRNASLPLQGSLREYGYFFATLQLGTPARHFSVIVDTGAGPVIRLCRPWALCVWLMPRSQAPRSPTYPAPTAGRPAGNTIRCLAGGGTHMLLIAR